MLGVTSFPGVTPADRVMRSVAHGMGVADTVVAAPVGVFFGTPGVTVATHTSAEPDHNAPDAHNAARA